MKLKKKDREIKDLRERLSLTETEQRHQLKKHSNSITST